jgi:uncharacterized protein YqgQ
MGSPIRNVQGTVQTGENDIQTTQKTMQDDQNAQIMNDAIEEPLISQELMPLRRSTRERRNTIYNDYVVYLQEHKFDIGMMEEDPENIHQALKCQNSEKWIEAMNDEIKSMYDNNVWDIVPLPEGAKLVGCKWIFKTKRDSKSNVERYKSRLVSKGFTQKKGIDYKEIFSLVSTKDSFRIIMALVAYLDLELHQMDVKTTFLNGELDEIIYMVQPPHFEIEDPKGMICQLKKSIYGLNQASRQ